MREHVRAEFALLALHNLNVGLHPVLLEVLRKQVRDVRIRVQSRELSSAPFHSGPRPAQRTVMNWKMKPSLPSSQTYSLVSFSPMPAFSQLKLGLRLYASQWPGRSLCTPSANSFACA